MSRLTAALLVALACVPALPAADPPAARAGGESEKAPNVVGKYDCTGEDVSGGRYTAGVTIKKTGDAYAVEWVSDDGQKFIGVGVLSGRTLAVSWLNQRVIGVMLYTVEADGSLSGKWSILGDPKGRVATEKLTRKLT